MSAEKFSVDDIDENLCTPGMCHGLLIDGVGDHYEAAHPASGIVGMGLSKLEAVSNLCHAFAAELRNERDKQRRIREQLDAAGFAVSGAGRAIEEAKERLSNEQN